MIRIQGRCGMIRIISLLCVVLFTAAFGLPFLGDDQGTEPVGGQTLAQQAAALSAGEWAPLTTANDWWDVGATYDDYVADCVGASPACIEVAGVSEGSATTIDAWNSAAYNPTTNTMYFWGAGHNNGGQVELTAFDFDTLTWEVRTARSLLNYDPPDRTIPLPTEVGATGFPEAPGAVHTYDGLVWDANNAEMLVFTGPGVYPSGSENSGLDSYWAIDPEAATPTWAHYDGRDFVNYPTCEYLSESTSTLCFQSMGQAYLYDSSHTETSCGTISGNGITSTIAMFFRDVFETPDELFVLGKQGMYELTPNGCSSTMSARGSAPSEYQQFIFSSDSVNGFWQGCPVATSADYIHVFTGLPQVLRFDKTDNTYSTIWNDSSQANGMRVPEDSDGKNRIFSKCIYFPTENVVAAIGTVEEPHPNRGWYIWKPGSNPATVNRATLGTLALDGATETTLSLFLPITAGDRDYDATAACEYKTQASGTWLDCPPLKRVRPEFVHSADTATRKVEVRQEGFYGMIWGLTAGEDYDVRVTVTEPDTLNGGTNPQTLAPSTLDVVTTSYGGLSTTNYSSNDNTTAINAALRTACNGTAGHVFTIDAGVTLSGIIDIRPDSAGDCGTAANPVVLRGANPTTSVIDGTGQSFGVRIYGGHVILENLTISGSPTTCVQVAGLEGHRELTGITVRDNTMTCTNDGINAGAYTIRNAVIENNTVTGPNAALNATCGGGREGIILSGQDGEIRHNTVQGFDDAIGTGYSIITGSGNEGVTKSLAIHHNLVPHTGDDTIEADFSQRNVVVHDNLIGNACNAMSGQPIWGGPVYFVHNIAINYLNGPIKFKAEANAPSGGYFWNNTFGRHGTCQLNFGVKTANLDVRNNLFICGGTQTGGNTFKMDGWMLPEAGAVENYNAFAVDGTFVFGDTETEANLAAWNASGVYGGNDVSLVGEAIFDTSTLDTFADTTDEFDSYTRVLTGEDFSLDSGSSAISAGVVIPGVTDDTPTIGACDPNDTSGRCDSTGTFYGVQ